MKGGEGKLVSVSYQNDDNKILLARVIESVEGYLSGCFRYAVRIIPVSVSGCRRNTHMSMREVFGLDKLQSE
mgnify:CR=1 FL=1